MASLFSRLGSSAATYSKNLITQSESANCSCQREGLRYVASKLVCLPERLAAAKTDLFSLVKTIRTGNFSAEQAQSGAWVGAQLAGLFVVGVVVGRRSIFGYSVAPLKKDEKSKHH